MTRKKKVGIITFHASHNYGSMLQAYALQQTVLNMGYDCEIINFRTKLQRKSYQLPLIYGTLKGRIKRTFLYAPYLLSLNKQYRLFESFLNKKYHLSSKEYTTLEELKQNILDYDIYISGSDQIWNTSCFDFDWAYFLPFAGHVRRIAYAPSMGAKPFRSINNEDTSKKIAELLSYYDYISVREQQTKNKIAQLTNLNCAVTLDPTLLIKPEIWNKMAGNVPLVSGDYIFLYTPWFNEAVYTEAERISKELNMPVVISHLHKEWKYNRNIIFKSYRCHLATGPIEFLNLCKFAVFSIGHSFHLSVFSILLRTPFYIINGMEDSRIRDLLVLTKLEHLGRKPQQGHDIIPSIDFNDAHNRIEKARAQSLEWLHKSLS